jgi:hypothetical protein
MVKSVNEMYSSSVEFELLPRHHKNVYFNVNQSSYSGIGTFIPQYKDDTIYELESQSYYDLDKPIANLTELTTVNADCLYDGDSYVSFLKELRSTFYEPGQPLFFNKIYGFPGIPIPFYDEIRSDCSFNGRYRLCYIKNIGEEHFNFDGEPINYLDEYQDATSYSRDITTPWTKHMTKIMDKDYYIIYKFPFRCSRIVGMGQYVRYFFQRMKYVNFKVEERLIFNYINEISNLKNNNDDCILESQSHDIIVTHMSDLWKNFHSPIKMEKEILTIQMLKSVLFVPYTSEILFPDVCGKFPSVAEEDLNRKAQSHFRSLGWNIVAYECKISDNTSYDLIICKPGKDRKDSIIGIVECKVCSPERTFMQVLTRMQTLNLPSVVGYSFGLNRITFFGSITNRASLNGVVTNTQLLDKCSNN